MFLYPIRDSKVTTSEENLTNREIETISRKSSLPFESASELDYFNFDPYLVSNSEQWNKVLRTNIYLISGTIAQADELKVAKMIIQNLPKDFKSKYLTREFITGFIPYLLIAFKITPFNLFEKDSNSIKHIIDFINTIYTTKSVDFSSILCAHRADRTLGINTLQAQVSVSEAIDAISVMHGMARSAGHLSSTYRLSQQSLSSLAGVTLMPEMIWTHILESKLKDLLAKLSQHWKDVHSMSFNNIYCSVEISSLESIYLPAIERLKQWQQQKLDKLVSSDNNQIEEVSQDFTQVSVERFHRFDNEYEIEKMSSAEKKHLLENNLKQTVSESEKPLITDIFQNFYWVSSLKLEERAFLETSVYAQWSMETFQKDEIAIGLDRDHRLYQLKSWPLILPKDSTHLPVLYARRSRENNSERLNNINLRQFWRKV